MLCLYIVRACELLNPPTGDTAAPHRFRAALGDEFVLVLAILFVSRGTLGPLGFFALGFILNPQSEYFSRSYGSILFTSLTYFVPWAREAVNFGGLMWLWVM